MLNWHSFMEAILSIFLLSQEDIAGHTFELDAVVLQTLTPLAQREDRFENEVDIPVIGLTKESLANKNRNQTKKRERERLLFF